MILDELAAYSSFRVAEAKKKIAADEMERKARSLPKGDFGLSMLFVTQEYPLSVK